MEQVISKIIEDNTGLIASPIFSTGPFPAVVYSLTPILGGAVKQSQLEVRFIGADYDDLLSKKYNLSASLDMEASKPSLSKDGFVLRSQLSGGGQLYNDGVQLYELLATFIITWRKLDD